MDRRQLRGLDIRLAAAALALVTIGILMIYSATHGAEESGLRGLAERQLVWAVFSIVIMVGAIFVSHDSLEAFSYVFYIGAVALLVLVLFVGGGKFGERRWFQIGSMSFQPSELAKYAVVFALARYLARRKRRLERPIDLIVPVGIALLPVALVLKEPDLGTSMIFVLVLLPMLYWAGMRPAHLFLLVTPVLSLAFAFNWIAWFIFLGFVAWALYVSGIFMIDKITVLGANILMGQVSPLVWSRLEEYQRHRIIAFLNPEKYRLSTGYQLIQSKIAIGSGRLLGKGFLAGTQKNFAFLPEQHSDFIFSVVGEEFGFVGCLVVLGLYVYLVLKMLKLASQLRSGFAALVTVGIASTLLIQTAINVGVTLGITPVTGMPLPLLSYGGSSLLVTMASIGLVMGMGIRRREY